MFDYCLALSVGDIGQASALVIAGRRLEWVRDPTHDLILQAYSLGKQISVVEVLELERLPVGASSVQMMARLKDYLRKPPLKDNTEVVTDAPEPSSCGRRISEPGCGGSCPVPATSQERRITIASAQRYAI